VTTTGHDAARRPRLTPAMADCRRAVDDALTAHLDTHAPGHLLVATSGGADSLALAWAAAFVAPKHGFTLEAVIVDHGLQHDSADVALEAQKTLTQMGVPATIIPVSVDGSGNVEDKARTARYDALDTHRLTTGAACVLLGHTLDDQAETVVLGLTRGSGPASIRGMAPYNPPWLRPFLGITRTTTEACITDAGYSYWLDPHNTDRRFVRPRIRHDILPALEDILGPGIPDALANTATLVADDDDYLNALADHHLSHITTTPGVLPVDDLAGLPSPIRRRVLRRWVRDIAGVSMTLAQTRMVDALVVAWRGQGAVDIPGATLKRTDDCLVIAPTTTQAKDQ
jgi:tRNA(Ile)-lysidine synthase